MSDYEFPPDKIPQTGVGPCAEREVVIPSHADFEESDDQDRIDLENWLRAVTKSEGVR